MNHFFQMRISTFLLTILLLATAQGHAQTFEEYLQKARNLSAEKNYAGAAHYYDLAFTQEDATAELYYEAALVWSLGGDKENAIWTLKKSAWAGWDDLKRLETEEVFIWLHEHPHWPSVLLRVRNNIENR